MEAHAFADPQRLRKTGLSGSLRDPNSGAYRHHGLSAALAVKKALMRLRKSHEETFLEWLSLSLAAKERGLCAYFQNVARRKSAGRWSRYLARAAPATSVSCRIPPAPPSAGNFKMEMEILLELLKNDSGGVLVSRLSATRVT